MRRGTQSLARQRGRQGGERGVAFTVVVLSIPVLVGFAALAVDIGRLALTANEVQNVADSAATAGATNLHNGGNAATAKGDAKTVGEKNWTVGSPATIRP